MRKEAWVHLKDAVTDHIDMTEVRVPPLMDDKLVVNLQATKKLLGIGGIEKLRVFSVSGDRVRSYPRSKGINEDGSALAGIAVSRGREKPNRYPVALGVPKGDQRIQVELPINADELERKVIESGGVWSEKAWAQELDKALKKGIRKAGVDFSLQLPGETYREKLANGLCDVVVSLGSPAAIVGGIILDEPSVVLMGSGITGLRLLLEAGLSLSEIVGKKPVRHSIFMFSHYERTVYLMLRTRTAKIIKPIKE